MKNIINHIIKSIAGFVLLFNILTLLWVLLYSVIPIPVTKLMVIEGRDKEIQYEWKDLDEISGKLQLAVMCAEDQYFLLHEGLDFRSIREAEEANKRGGNMRGASTITQQVAKNVFLWPDRTYLRKAAELYFSLLIEIVWSKKRIMEAYLNVAEFGDGIFGAEAAAQAYFKKSAKDLTTSQAASLAAILPSPKRYSAVSPSPYVQQRITWIKKQMWYWGYEMTYDPEFVKKMVK
ncbi:monofunctional biosynthetic peptidoglycan transglycosylase [Ekhidna sp.]|uniref:monofunctional biosynthetic peptidoglycan transglycosylase n=1 Tax=Ekhidna sp. TaxID=2608089 RepID=UPI003CCBA8C4